MEAFDGDDDLLIILRELDDYSDEENFDDDFLNVASFPQQITGTLEAIRKQKNVGFE